jgi:hypothetical protein
VSFGPWRFVTGTLVFFVVRFNDNALVDAPGADLYVFEVGPNIEGLRLAISQDGTTWTEAGVISGGTAEVDIARVAKAGERYRYVRVTDMKSARELLCIVHRSRLVLDCGRA